MLQLHHNISQTELPCILFLHGFLGSMNQWDEIQSRLTDYSVFKVDLPGHGYSLDSSNPYSIDDLADQIELLIRSYNLSSIHLVGHSMGGYVAANIGYKISDRIRSLTLINSIAAGDSTERILSRDRSLKLVTKFKNAFVNMAIANLFTVEERAQFVDEIQAMKKQAENITTDSVKNAILAMRNRKSSLEKLRHIKLEVHYIYSTTDSIIPKQKVLKEIELLNAKSHEIESGHMSILTHSEKISTILNIILADQ